MPSGYCVENPNSVLCAINPNYGVFNPNLGGGNVNNFPVYGNPEYNPNIGVPTGMGNLGGWPGGSSGQLSQVLNSILAGMGILAGANYIPTPLQSGQFPQGAGASQPIVNNYYSGGAGGGVGGGGNTFGKIESWIRQNTGAAAIIGGAAVLYFMKSPRQAGR